MAPADVGVGQDHPALRQAADDQGLGPYLHPAPSFRTSSARTAVCVLTDLASTVNRPAFSRALEDLDLDGTHEEYPSILGMLSGGFGELP